MGVAASIHSLSNLDLRVCERVPIREDAVDEMSSCNGREGALAVAEELLREAQRGAAAYRSMIDNTLLLTFLPLNRSVSTTLVSRSPSNSVTSGKLSPTCTIRRRVAPELAPSHLSQRYPRCGPGAWTPPMGSRHVPADRHR